MLSLVKVNKSYRRGNHEVTAVKNVSLTLRPHTLTAVMGPSGCGKSTLLTIAGGLLPPDEGSVMVESVELTTLSEQQLYAHRRKRIGYVFQDYNLVQMLSVIENVALPAELDGLKMRDSRVAARRALAAVGLDGFEDYSPDSLSGGQQQRVALARAFAGGSKLILADEPTGALDSDSAEQVIEALLHLVSEGSTCLVATHDTSVAARAGCVFRMRDGVLHGQEHGSLAAVT